jgi:transposase
VERELLEEMLGEGASLAQIGRRAGLHEATVSYWLAKHGLAAAHGERHGARGAIAREDLQSAVSGGMTIAEIAESLHRSKATVRYWLARYELSTGNRAGRRVRGDARAALEAGLATALLVCPRHGHTRHALESRGYYRCCRCRQEAVVRRRRRAKEILVAEHGGRCRLCGYDRCMAALQFHHHDPATKTFGVAQGGMGRSIKRLRAEVRKCILLCSNCHAEVESGFARIPG